MTPFTKKVIAVIRQIPAGKVMTYGQVAEQAGQRRGARQVVRVLHSMSQKYDLPWHRVVNRLGEIAIQDEEQKYSQIALLQKEGVFLDASGRISLEKYRYLPEPNADIEAN